MEAYVKADHAPDAGSVAISIRNILLDLARRDGRNMSIRQLTILLICYSESELHTFQDLTRQLNTMPSGISRALDRLEELGLVRRTPNPEDGRSVFVGRTAKGGEFVRNFITGAEPAWLPAPAPQPRSSPAGGMPAVIAGYSPRPHR